MRWERQEPTECVCCIVGWRVAPEKGWKGWLRLDGDGKDGCARTYGLRHKTRFCNYMRPVRLDAPDAHFVVADAHAAKKDFSLT